MRIAVTTFGSEGDTRPFVALTRALNAAGHDAFLCAAEMFRDRAVQAGIPFASTGPLKNEESFRNGLERVMREPNPLKSGAIVFEVAEVELLARLRPVLEATADVDLVVHHVIDVAGFAAARVHNKARVSVSLAPGIWSNRRSLANGTSLGSVPNLALGAVMRQALPDDH